MRLSGRQIAQLRDALLSAYATRDELRALVRIGLDENLDALADGSNLRVVVFNLVAWAEQQGRVGDLVRSVHEDNPNNPQVQALWRDAQGWPIWASATTAQTQVATETATPVASLAPASPVSIDVFLSYSRKNDAAMHRVFDVLRKAGLSVWTDAGLEPGTPAWSAAIQEAIGQANVFVVLLSPEAKASVWVNNEIAYAGAMRKPRVPLLVAGDETDAAPISLINTQWIDGRADVTRAATDQLLPVIGRYVQPAAGQGEKQATGLGRIEGEPNTAAPESATPETATPGTAAPETATPAWRRGVGGAGGATLRQRPWLGWAIALVALALIAGGAALWWGFTQPTTVFNAAAFSPDGKTIAAAGADNSLRLWDAATGALTNTLQGHTAAVNAVDYSPDGTLIVSAGNDDSVDVWDVAAGKLVRKLEGHTADVLAVAVSPDGRTVASGGRDRTVRLGDVGVSKLLLTLAGHTGTVNGVAFSPDGRTVASAGDDGTVRMWNVPAGVLLRVLTGHSGPVYAVAYSPGGRSLATAGNDHTIRLWDAASGHALRTLQGHSQRVWSVAFSPDGKTLASASDDGTVKLWDLAGNAEPRTLAGHTDAVLSVAFSPDGKTLVSTSDDKTVRLWDVGTGETLRVLKITRL